jgi:trans-aconitate methyltransferase
MPLKTTPVVNPITLINEGKSSQEVSKNHNGRTFTNLKQNVGCCKAQRIVAVALLTIAVVLLIIGMTTGSLAISLAGATLGIVGALKHFHSWPQSQKPQAIKKTATGLEANLYSKNASKQTEWALNFFRSKYKITGNEKKVLDFGCGDGSILVEISKLFANQSSKSAAQFTGMDISKSMIDKAANDYPREQYKNVTFAQGGVENISHKNSFDLIVSFSTLHFVLEQEKALQKIHESLALGGTALILVPSKTEKNMNPLAGSLMTSDKWKAYFPEGYIPSRVYFTQNEYEKMLSSVGFTAIDIEIISNEDIYPSMDAFVESLVAVLNYVPLKIRREFAKDLANLLDISEGPTGTVHFRNKSLQIVARNCSQ